MDGKNASGVPESSRGKSPRASWIHRLAGRLARRSSTENADAPKLPAAEDLLTVLAVNGMFRAVESGEPSEFQHELEVLERLGREARFDVGLTRTLFDETIATLRGHGFMGCPCASGLVFSPDGAMLVSGGGSDGTIRIWDVMAGKQLGESLVGHESGVNSIAVSPDGRVLASGSNDQTIRLWDGTTGSMIGEPFRGHEAIVDHVMFTPDGSTLISCGRDHKVRFWNVPSGRPIGDPIDDCRSFCLALSPDGSLIAGCGEDNTIRFWNSATRQPVGEPLQDHQDLFLGLAFSPDGSMLASGGFDGTIRFWDVAARRQIGEPIVVFDGPSPHADGTKFELGSRVAGLAFSPDGSILASSSPDENGVRIWDVASRELRGLRRGVSLTCVAFSPDGAMLAAGGNDAAIRVWDLQADLAMRGHDRAVRAIVFSPDGNRLASGDDRGVIRQWDVATGQPLDHGWSGHDSALTHLVFSPDGTMLSSGARDGEVRLWRTEAADETREPITLEGSKKAVRTLAFETDGSTLTAVDGDGTVCTWNIEVGTLLRKFKVGSLRGTLDVAILSRDAATLATAHGGIAVWDVPDGTRVGHVDWPFPNPTCMTWSASGSVLAVGSCWIPTGPSIVLWNMVTGEARGPLLRPVPKVGCLAVSPDDAVLATGDGLGRIQLWDVATRRPLGEPMPAHEKHITSLAFSPDGRVLASGGADGQVRLWHAVPIRDRIGAIRARRLELQTAETGGD